MIGGDDHTTPPFGGKDAGSVSKHIGLTVITSPRDDDPHCVTSLFLVAGCTRWVDRHHHIAEGGRNICRIDPGAV
jgi:hypothetical protein